MQTLEGRTDEVRAVAFSHDGSLLASASIDRTVRLWNPHTGQEMQTLEGHTDEEKLLDDKADVNAQGGYRSVRGLHGW